MSKTLLRLDESFERILEDEELLLRGTGMIPIISKIRKKLLNEIMKDLPEERAVWSKQLRSRIVLSFWGTGKLREH